MRMNAKRTTIDRPCTPRSGFHASSFRPRCVRHRLEWTAKPWSLCWMSLPGRTPPVIVVRLPERRRGWLKEK